MYNISNSLISLLFLGILLLFAKFGEELFKRFKLISYISAIIIGIILGPGVFNLINVLPDISLFISLGIDFLIFAGGAMEFREINLRNITKFSNIIIGITEFIVPFLIISIIVYYIFKNIEVSIISGIVIGMSSAGPLTRLLSDTGLNKTEEGNKIFQEVVVIEISAVILFSFIIDLHGKKIDIENIMTIGLELFLSMIAIILFGKYVLIKLLENIDLNSKSRETLISVIISFVFILGFIGQLYGFNAAIVSLFLGIILRNFIGDRPLIAEKVSTITYGFFEPLFFIGLGLYFVKITIFLLLTGFIIFIIGLLFKPLSGFIISKFINVDKWKNALGTSVNGGVDAALLVVALSFTLINPYDYSIIMIAITLLTLVIPLLFNIKAPIINKKTSGYKNDIILKEFKNLNAYDISKIGENIYLNYNDGVKKAFEICFKHNSGSVVIVNDENYVIGQLLLKNILSLNSSMDILNINDIDLEEIKIVKYNTTGSDLVKIFRDINPEIIAVTDDNNKFIGTILEKEILKNISGLMNLNAM